MTISEDELRARLQLWRAPGFGSASMSHLLGFFGSISQAMENSNYELAKAGLKPKAIEILRATRPVDADADLNWLMGNSQRQILTPEHPAYPELLKATRYTPPIIFAVGNIELLNDPQIAMVGSRNPTSGGKENAYAFAAHLAESGLCITSGLALGIDAQSHLGALDHNGSTIAVVATGMDIIYPSQNRQLAERIAEKGLIISEFPTGVRPQGKNFPRRNRIISGLSVGTLVVEAALRSGSLVTAKHAMDQSREVFAIPGSIHNPMARGCHQLIRQGAKLVETAQDILEEVAAQLHNYLQPDLALEEKAQKAPQLTKAENSNKILPEQELDGDEHRILEALGHDPVPIDQIVMKTGLTTEEVSSMLLMLELKGYVAACGGGNYMQLTPRE